MSFSRDSKHILNTSFRMCLPLPVHKKICLFLSLFIMLSSAAGQNLVLNPSMEDYVECPRMTIPINNSIEMAEHWGSPTISSDYYNVCRIGFFFTVPNSGFGYQYPRTGDAFVGAYLWSEGDNGMIYSALEYIEGSLSSSLKQDSFYLVEFFINCAGLGHSPSYAVDQVSMLFTPEWATFPYEGFITPPYITTPDLTSPAGVFFRDTVGWQRVKWIYQARGDELFFTVGLFRPKEEVNFIPADGDGPTIFRRAYYYFDDFRIEKIPRPMAWSGLGTDTLICADSFELTLSGNPNHYHYEWSTGDTTRQITVDTPGVYVLKSWFADSCEVVDSILVEQLVPGTLDLGEDVDVCPSDLPYSLSAGIEQGTFLWSTGDTLSGITIEEGGAYWVEVSTPCGQYRDTIAVRVLYPPLLGIEPDTLICDEAVDILLEAGEGYDGYEWSMGVQGRQIRITSPGWYWVEGTYACGSIRDSILVRLGQLEALDLGADTVLCLSEPLLLEAPAWFETYRWSTGATSPSITVGDYGVYALEAGYECGILRDTIRVTAPPEWSVRAPKHLLLPWDSTRTILVEESGAADALAYHWSPSEGLSCTDCLRPEVSPTYTRDYELEVEDNYGCRQVLQVSVEVVVPHHIYFPNAFSPNDDGINDFFSPLYGDEVINVHAMQIFNRWGDMVYSATDGFKWDGRWQGHPAALGVYVYQADVEFADGNREIVSGEVLLVR